MGRFLMGKKLLKDAGNWGIYVFFSIGKVGSFDFFESSRLKDVSKFLSSKKSDVSEENLFTLWVWLYYRAFSYEIWFLRSKLYLIIFLTMLYFYSTICFND